MFPSLFLSLFLFCYEPFNSIQFCSVLFNFDSFCPILIFSIAHDFFIVIFIFWLLPLCLSPYLSLSLSLSFCISHSLFRSTSLSLCLSLNLSVSLNLPLSLSSLSISLSLSSSLSSLSISLSLYLLGVQYFVDKFMTKNRTIDRRIYHHVSGWNWVAVRAEKIYYK